MELQKEKHVQRIGGRMDQGTSEKLKAVRANVDWHIGIALFLSCASFHISVRATGKLDLTLLYIYSQSNVLSSIHRLYLLHLYPG